MKHFKFPAFIVWNDGRWRLFLLLLVALLSTDLIVGMVAAAEDGDEPKLSAKGKLLWDKVKGIRKVVPSISNDNQEKDVSKHFCRTYPAITRFFRLYNKIYLELRNNFGHYLVFDLRTRKFGKTIVTREQLLGKLSDHYTSIVSMSALNDDFFDHSHPIEKLPRTTTELPTLIEPEMEQKPNSHRTKSKSNRNLTKRENEYDYIYFTEIVTEIITDPPTTTTTTEAPTTLDPPGPIIPVRIWGFTPITVENIELEERIGYDDFSYSVDSARLLRKIRPKQPAWKRRTRFPFSCFIHFEGHGTIAIVSRRFQESLTEYNREYRYQQRYMQPESDEEDDEYQDYDFDDDQQSEAKEEQQSSRPDTTGPNQTGHSNRKSHNHHHQRNNNVHHQSRNNNNKNPKSHQKKSYSNPFDIDLKLFYSDQEFKSCIEMNHSVVLLQSNNKLIVINRQEFLKPFMKISNTSITKYYEINLHKYLCSKNDEYSFDNLNIEQFLSDQFAQKSQEEQRQQEETSLLEVHDRTAEVVRNANISSLLARVKISTSGPVNKALFVVVAIAVAGIILFVILSFMFLYMRKSQRQTGQQQQQKQQAQQAEQAIPPPSPALGTQIPVVIPPGAAVLKQKF